MSKTLLTVCCLGLSLTFLVSASDWDKKTVVTLNEPLIVAGVPVVTLEPGKYVVRLLDSSSNRHIVQIFNEREDKLFTTVLAIPNYRLEPKDKTAFSYWETPTGNPSALRAWFYPGDNFGQEFVYPKGLAARIAREAGATVLATPAESEAELRTAPLTEIDRAGAEQPVVEEALAAPVPRPSPVAAAPAPEPVPTPAPQAPEPAAPPALPATASPYFTVGLVGLLVLGTGAFLRLARSRVTSR